MKPILNRNRKSSVINKVKNYQRKSTLNQTTSNKNKNILLNQEFYSIFKTNRTLQKYIDQRLSSLNPTTQPQKKTIEYKSYNNTRNNSFNLRKSNNNKITKKKINNNNSIKSKESKLNLGRNNSKKQILSLKKQYKTKQNYSSFNNLPNIKYKNYNTNKNLFKSPIQTKGKLIKNFCQNYSSSVSTGISLKNNNEIYKPCTHFLDNNSFVKNENSENELEENQDFEIIPFNNKEFQINSNEDRNNKSMNNNYEIDTIEDNMIDNKILFKGGENGSPITFGNSFSYTNSKKSSSTRRVLKNEDIEKDDESISILKSQNETLKKELKESNQQITFLKNEIEKLIKKRKIKNFKQCIQIRSKCPDSITFIKKFSKNNPCLEQNIFEFNNYHSHHDLKINQNNVKILKNKRK